MERLHLNSSQQCLFSCNDFLHSEVTTVTNVCFLPPEKPRIPGNVPDNPGIDLRHIHFRFRIWPAVFRLLKPLRSLPPFRGN
ncbi:unnamed protein product [Allacma fusca]|uniref:Uncharacterized protein n=1 Tax=Allacma fusca TaxID=39272 RepID=A0A8J2K0M9_9HEXA|nr:unnamed protein product [Allacma fusca]